MRRLIVSLFLTASIAQAADTPPVPPPNELRQLLVESLLAFNQAVAAKDFTAFHASISALWQQQITPAKMKETFQPYIDKRIDLSNVVRVDPVYSEPAKIDENGVLIVQGVYPTAPTKVDFRLKFLRVARHDVEIRYELLQQLRATRRRRGENDTWKFHEQ